ncbi:MAG TPA: hypothetical protein ENI97_02730 [Gammaproteobacteria bacterium]|nr:hypothetical protein [Gammaproteobacteria bacterium]
MKEVKPRRTFWQRYMDKYGIRKLPREIVRPFEVCGADYLDDKELRIAPSWGMEMWLYILRNLAYTAAFVGLIVSVVAPTKFDTPIYSKLFFISLAVGVILHIASYLIPKRQAVFDRTTGMVRTPNHPLIRKKASETPFEEWEAITTFHYTQIGSPTYRLFIRNTKIPYIVLVGASSTFDEVLGMWSFLLQYMKKDAPLPDVQSFKKYPNRTKGLGSWEEWKWKSRLSDFVDPYEVAKARMEQEQAEKKHNNAVGTKKPHTPAA